MNPLPLASLILALALTSTQAGPEHLIKQRAKDVRDQNNARQGVTLSAPSAPPAGTPSVHPSPIPYAPQPAGPLLSSQGLKIAESLEWLSKSAEVTDAQRQQLVASLTAACRKGAKPSESKITRLARDLALAVAGKETGSAQRSKLAAQLERGLNDSLNAKEMETLTSEVQATLRNAGAGKVEATVVANGLKSIVAERQKGAKD